MRSVMGKGRIHFQFWVIYITFFAVLISIEGNFSFGFYWLHFLFDLPAVFLFAYPLAYWIYPNYKKRNVFWLVGSVVALSLLASLVKLLTTYEVFYSLYLPNELAPNNYFTLSHIGRNLFWVSLPSILLVLMRFYMASVRMQKERSELIKNRLEAELSMLKSQLNPHFLFNVLNNLYSLTISKSDKAPKLIARLSNLFEFMLYQSNKPLVLLSDEIELIQTYAELQGMKYGKRLKFSIDYDPQVLNKQVAPLLLFPFVENCYKHGCSNDPNEPKINISINAFDEKIKCQITNTKPNNSSEFKDKKQGIGIENTRKRLEILYTDTHKLSIRDMKDCFIVDLTLIGEPKTDQYYAQNNEFISLV